MCLVEGTQERAHHPSHAAVERKHKTTRRTDETPGASPVTCADGAPEGAAARAHHLKLPVVPSS
jgi:hypothetical protein